MTQSSVATPQDSGLSQLISDYHTKILNVLEESGAGHGPDGRRRKETICRAVRYSSDQVVIETAPVHGNAVGVMLDLIAEIPRTGGLNNDFNMELEQVESEPDIEGGVPFSLSIRAHTDTGRASIMAAYLNAQFDKSGHKTIGTIMRESGLPYSVRRKDDIDVFILHATKDQEGILNHLKDHLDQQISNRRALDVLPHGVTVMPTAISGRRQNACSVDRRDDGSFDLFIAAPSLDFIQRSLSRQLSEPASTPSGMEKPGAASFALGVLLNQIYGADAPALAKLKMKMGLDYFMSENPKGEKSLAYKDVEEIMSDRVLAGERFKTAVLSFFPPQSESRANAICDAAAASFSLDTLCRRFHDIAKDREMIQWFMRSLFPEFKTVQTLDKDDVKSVFLDFFGHKKQPGQSGLDQTLSNDTPRKANSLGLGM